jgi:hypothetical protein
VHSAHRLTVSQWIISCTGRNRLAPGRCIAVLVVNSAAWHQLWVLFVMGAVSALLYGLQRPSQDALVPVLVGHDDLPAGAGLVGLLGNAASRAGPLLGGGVIALGGLASA